MLEVLETWIRALAPSGTGDFAIAALTRTAACVVTVALAFIANFVAKRVIVSAITHLIQRTGSARDDVFVERKVFHKLSHIAPAAVIYLLAPQVLEGSERLTHLVVNLSIIYMIVVVAFALDSMLNALLDMYRTFDISKDIPIKGFVQVVKIALYFIATILVISAILDKTPLYFLSGLGALTAVLMLIFKDAILGFVAGIQLTANRMVKRGDWIEMPKYGADGDVLDIALTTVKVQNWDKTITTIPTYALISDSFKNWRGMQESGGRRIKRAIYLDMSSIKFCDEEMLKRFAKIQFISDYIEKKRAEVAEYNQEHSVDDSSLVNGRRLTNIGTLRAYILAYLENHPMISDELTLLVRQLAPTSEGLPIEIYVFSKDKVWANYEALQADIIDHFLAVVPEFDLRVYQQPTGADLARLGAS